MTIDPNDNAQEVYEAMKTGIGLVVVLYWLSNLFRSNTSWLSLLCGFSIAPAALAICWLMRKKLPKESVLRKSVESVFGLHLLETIRAILAVLLISAANCEVVRQNGLTTLLLGYFALIALVTIIYLFVCLVYPNR